MHSPVFQPLVGRWRQAEDILCVQDAWFELPPADPISMLEIRADGTYAMIRARSKPATPIWTAPTRTTSSASA